MALLVMDTTTNKIENYTTPGDVTLATPAPGTSTTPTPRSAPPPRGSSRGHLHGCSWVATRHKETSASTSGASACRRTPARWCDGQEGPSPERWQPRPGRVVGRTSPARSSPGSRSRPTGPTILLLRNTEISVTGRALKWDSFRPRSTTPSGSPLPSEPGVSRDDLPQEEPDRRRGRHATFSAHPASEPARSTERRGPRCPLALRRRHAWDVGPLG